MEGYKELCLGSDPQNYSTLPKKKCQRTNHFFRASHLGGLLLLAVGADTITYSTKTNLDKEILITGRNYQEILITGT